MTRFSSSAPPACFNVYPPALPEQPVRLCSPAMDFPPSSGSHSCPVPEVLGSVVARLQCLLSYLVMFPWFCFIYFMFSHTKGGTLPIPQRISTLPVLLTGLRPVTSQPSRTSPRSTVEPHYLLCPQPRDFITVPCWVCVYGGGA